MRAFTEDLEVEELYTEYIENEAAKNGDELHENWRRISAELDRKLTAGTITTADLARYEEAVAHAAFFAGFTAAGDE